MRRKLLLLPLLVACILLLSAVSLARPEPEGYGDRFVGFHIVADSRSRPLLNCEDGNWSSYAGRQVLWGVKTGDCYEFPGLPGKNCFLEWLYEGGEPCLSSCSQLADTFLTMGDKQSITATLYSSAEVLRFFRVYQTADGRIYLDGSGNGYSGAVGGFAVTEDRTWTERSGDAVTREESFHIEVSVKEPPAVVEAAVKCFSSGDALLEEQIFDGSGEGTEVALPVGTAWVLVEERSAEGAVARTVHTPGGEEDTHTIWFPDGVFYRPFVLTFVQ